MSSSLAKRPPSPKGSNESTFLNTEPNRPTLHLFLAFKSSLETAGAPRIGHQSSRSPRIWCTMTSAMHIAEKMAKKKARSPYADNDDRAQPWQAVVVVRGPERRPPSLARRIGRSVRTWSRWPEQDRRTHPSGKGSYAFPRDGAPLRRPRQAS